MTIGNLPSAETTAAITEVLSDASQGFPSNSRRDVVRDTSPGRHSGLVDGLKRHVAPIVPLSPAPV